jgi:hypothetical protein
MRAIVIGAFIVDPPMQTGQQRRARLAEKGLEMHDRLAGLARRVLG